MRAKRKPLCYVCKRKPAKLLSSRYQHAADYPVFCSLRCAADHGLLYAADPQMLSWCHEHGWWSVEMDGAECPRCVHALIERGYRPCREHGWWDAATHEECPACTPDEPAE